MNARPGSPTRGSPCPRPSIWAWTAPGCPYDRPRCRGGRANNPTGRPQRDPGSVTYTAAIESAATLDTDPQLSEFARAKANDAVLGKRHGKSSWETERGGFGISPASSSRRRCRLSIVFTPKSDSIRSRRVCMPTASPGRSGPNNVARNSMPVGSRPSCRSSPPRPLTTRRDKRPAPISKRIDIACVTRSSRPRGSAPQPGWWKPDARTPSGRDSNDPECIGACGEPIPLWLSAAFDSAGALRTSGNGDPIPKPPLDPVITFLSCTLLPEISILDLTFPYATPNLFRKTTRFRL